MLMSMINACKTGQHNLAVPGHQSAFWLIDKQTAVVENLNLKKSKCWKYLPGEMQTTFCGRPNEDQGKIPDDKVLELKKMPSLHTCFSSLICYIKIFFVESNN